MGKKRKGPPKSPDSGKLSDGNEDGSFCSSEEKNYNLRNRIRPGTGTIPKGKAAVSEKDGSSDETSSEQEDEELQAAQGTADSLGKKGTPNPPAGHNN
ncbi:hypothetical protein QE152_g13508 [Popillia japonica]|uniref:Uncharacterized protein n=1 Tax=Popillia japonica TaxID=7064 RepID=A0AAW1LDU4_POPJA